MVTSQTLKRIPNRAILQNSLESIPNHMSQSAIVTNAYKLISSETIVIMWQNRASAIPFLCLIGVQTFLLQAMESILQKNLMYLQYVKQIKVGMNFLLVCPAKIVP